MNNHSINKASTQKQKAKPALLFMLIALFLLTTCPIKRSIDFLFFDNTAIETFGLNDQKTVSENGKYLAAGAGLCSNAEQVINIQVSQTSSTIFPINLALSPAFSSVALLNKVPDPYFSKVFFYKASTPVYIRNRRLLI